MAACDIENLPLNLLSLDECRRDSPQFRHALSESERELNVLQARYSDCAGACRRMVDDGKQYFDSMRIFVNTLDTLKSSFGDNDKVIDGAMKCLKILNEFREQGVYLLDRFSEAEVKLLSFHQDLKKLSETKRYFERASDDLDDSLGRSLGIPIRPRHHVDTEEHDNMTDACRKSFLHVSIDYVRQIRGLRLEKNCHLLETLRRIINSGLKEYHHQGWDFMNRVDVWSEHISQQIEFARDQADEERKRMDNWQRSVFDSSESPSMSEKTKSKAVGESGDSQSENTANAVTNKSTHKKSGSSSSDKEVQYRTPKLSVMPRQFSSQNGIKMRGYLFRKTSKKLAKSWVRRWFVLTNNQLTYCKRSEPNDAIMLESDLRICTAKPLEPNESAYRRFCFLLIAPDHSHQLQAESADEMKIWVDAFQAGINCQMNTFRRQSTPTNPNNESGSASKDGKHFKHSASFRGALGTESSVFGASNHSNGGNFTDRSRTTDQDSAGYVENKLKKEYKENKERACRKIRALAGNDVCCECGADSKWASINLGITLCVECSGGHRSLGVHLSKVKSLLLDEWGPEVLRVMTSLGNTIVNRIYEGAYYESEEAAAKLPPKLKPKSTREMRDTWIRAKWLERRFVVPITMAELIHLLTAWRRQHNQKHQSSGSVSQSTSKQGDEDSICSGTCGPDGVTDESIEQLAAELIQLTPDQLLHRSSRMRCLPVMMSALAHGANPNWEDPDDLNKSPLHHAVDSGSLAACELLLLNGTKLNSEDSEGRSPLHYACLRQHKFQVTLFAKRSDLRLYSTDHSGMKPLDLALNTGNADIVTILRMLALNEASREDTMGGDETVNDIFRDFRNRAYTEEDCDADTKLI